MFAKNLKYLRAKRGIEQIELARMLGRKSGSSISSWESGTYTPKIGTLAKIADIFNVDLDDLMNIDLSDGPRPSNLIPVNTAAVSFIPILGTIKCGQPILAEENITGYREELSDRLPSGNLFYLKSQGDSMVPTIPEGSLVLIREQPTVEYGEVAAVLVNGDTDATLKRVKKQGDIVMLIADNPDYPPYIITDDNPARIIGKAVQVSVDL